MRVLVAPDKFRGTLTAAAAAAAISAGWRRGDPDARIETLPVADGGEGTLDVLLEALGGERRTVAVRGPLGEPVVAPFGLVRLPGEDAATTAVVELAGAAGLGLVAPDRRDVKRATTRGVGEVLVAVARAGVRRAIVAVGGSATVDGGAGIAQAVGGRLVDAEGRPLGPGGAALLGLERIDLSRVDPLVRGLAIDVAADVDSPLTGPGGAAHLFGPQKGATPADVELLDRALGRLAEVVLRDLGIDLRTLVGAGAAGGAAAGLAAFLGARVRPGAEVVLGSLDLASRLARADVVVTGEGSFDAQTRRGKAPAAVLAAAAERGVARVVLCGRADPAALGAWPGIPVLSLAERFGARAETEEAADLLAALAEEAARSGRG